MTAPPVTERPHARADEIPEIRFRYLLEIGNCPCPNRILTVTRRLIKMTTNPRKSPRPRGRPSREDELRRAMAEFGIDPELVDPRRVLASIAVDTNAPASARVAAARALLGGRAGDLEDAGDAAQINDRAIARMRAN
jgi:hypothetical protein